MIRRLRRWTQIKNTNEDRSVRLKWFRRTEEMLRIALTVLFLILGNVSAFAQNVTRPAEAKAPLHRIDPKTAEGLRKILAYSAERLPVVSAHRGGPQAGFPENCIATFENTLQHTYAFLEIDPRLTKDGAIVVLHDPTLERTTTGRGKLADLTLAEVRKLRLKDPQGNVTPY